MNHEAPRVPEGIVLDGHLAEDAVDEAAALLEGQYWVRSFSREELRETIAESRVRVGARDARGRLVAFARATCDRRVAWIYDVVVAEDARGTGVGLALMRLLLDLPLIRRVRHVRLGTRDAMDFYRRLGFCELSEAPRPPWNTTEMIRVTT